MMMSTFILSAHLAAYAGMTAIYLVASRRHWRGEPDDKEHELRLACAYSWLVLVLAAELALDLLGQ